MSDPTLEAPEIAKAEVPGLGNPVPAYRNSLEKVDLVDHSSSSIDHYDESTPTEEELETLRRVPGRIPWICFTVAFVELCERFAYYGTTAVLANFIQRPLPFGSTTGSDPRPDGRPGALGQGQKASFGMITFNRFWSYFMPLLGGYLADAHWGRIFTIHASIWVAMLGHVIIIVSALPPVIRNSDGALGCLAVGIIFFGAGVGGFKANVAPLMAEQLEGGSLRIKTLSSGERVIIDPALTTQRAFMWFYACINIGSVAGQISMVYAERYVGFWLSFLLPTILFGCAPIVLLIFRNRYVRLPPTGSVLGKAVALIGFACKGKLVANPATSYKNLNSPNFWEDVKPSKVNPSRKPRWMTFDDAWVDEVSRGIKACKVFLFFPLFWLAYNQIDSNLTSQANTLELHGVPNDLINNMNPIGIIIMIPIMDLLIYPALRKANIRFSPIQRMTTGFFVACAAMIWAAVLQYYIYKTGPCGSYMNTCDIPAAPINVWAQTGAYVLIGLAEIMASITSLEYAFTKAPANMRSLVYGFYYFTSAISAALGQAFVPLSDDPNLVWNYGSVAIIAFVGGIGFWLCFRKLDKEEESLNMLPESTYKGNQENSENGSVESEQRMEKV